jgi:hypothetical protein
MVTAYRLTRPLPLSDETATLSLGDIVFKFTGFTYGCISTYGVAVTRVPEKGPFFEIPLAGLQKIETSIIEKGGRSCLIETETEAVFATRTVNHLSIGTMVAGIYGEWELCCSPSSPEPMESNGEIEW